MTRRGNIALRWTSITGVRWVLLCVLCLWVLPRPVSASTPDPINAVLGDHSWISQHGEAPGPDATEVERIRVHLAFVEQELRDTDVSGLTVEQQANRGRALDALARYIEAGDFPRRTSDEYEGRRPRFIDDRGVHCAVGEMIRATGEPALAAELDRRHEYDYVAQMSDEPLLAWAERFGFTPLELAMIQPSYGRPTPRASMRSGTLRSIDEATVACAADHPPVPGFTLHLRGKLKERFYRFEAWSPRRNRFVACVMRELEEYDPFIYSRLYEQDPRSKSRRHEKKPQRVYLRMRVEILPVAEILAGRIDAITFGGDCVPRPGEIPDTVEVNVWLGDTGRVVLARTTPSNREVDRCLTAFAERELEAFTASQRPVEIQRTRPVRPRFTTESLERAIETWAPKVASRCFESGLLSFATIHVRAVAAKDVFEIELEDEDQDSTFASCMIRRMDEALQESFSVSRTTPEGSREPYFRIDHDAEATVVFDVEPPRPREW